MSGFYKTEADVCCWISQWHSPLLFSNIWNRQESLHATCTHTHTHKSKHHSSENPVLFLFFSVGLSDQFFRLTSVNSCGTHDWPSAEGPRNLLPTGRIHTPALLHVALLALVQTLLVTVRVKTRDLHGLQTSSLLLTLGQRTWDRGGDICEVQPFTPINRRYRRLWWKNWNDPGPGSGINTKNQNILSTYEGNFPQSSGSMTTALSRTDSRTTWFDWASCGILL